MALGLSSLMVGAADAQLSYVGQFGGSGSGPGQFLSPTDVSVAADGSIYAVDSGNDRVERFTSGYAYSGQWGAEGAAAGDFYYPYGVAVAGNDVYVSDVMNQNVQTWATNDLSTPAATWKTEAGSPYGNPYGIAVDAANDKVYVANGANTADGEVPAVEVYSTSGTTLTPITGSGLDGPKGVAVDGLGNLYVANTSAGDIKVFNSAGGLLRTIGAAGQGDGQLNDPEGVAVDAQNNVWVADTQSNRIEEFSATGTFLGAYASAGYAGNFAAPTGMAFDASGNLFVVDRSSDRVLIFATGGSTGGGGTGGGYRGTGGGGGTGGGSSPVATIAGVSTLGSAALVTIKCQGSPGLTCAGGIVVSAREQLRGRTMDGVSARAHRSAVRTVVVTVARDSYSVSASATRVLTFALNATGKQLLARFYRLPATVKLPGASNASRPITFSYPRVRALLIACTWYSVTPAGYTSCDHVTIRGLPRSARVVIECTGPGCPFAGRALKPSGGNIDFAGPLVGTRLWPGAQVLFVITAPNQVGEVKVYTIVYGNVSVSYRCLPPGARKPLRCAT